MSVQTAANVPLCGPRLPHGGGSAEGDDGQHVVQRTLEDTRHRQAAAWLPFICRFEETVGHVRSAACQEHHRSNRSAVDEEMIRVQNTIAYDLEELSAKLGVSERTLRRYIHAGKLQAFKLGNKYFVTQRALDAYFDTPSSDWS